MELFLYAAGVSRGLLTYPKYVYVNDKSINQLKQAFRMQIRRAFLIYEEMG